MSDAMAEWPKHGFGSPVKCRGCGALVNDSFALDWKTASRGFGLCEDCYSKRTPPTPDSAPVEPRVKTDLTDTAGALG